MNELKMGKELSEDVRKAVKATIPALEKQGLELIQVSEADHLLYHGRLVLTACGSV